MIIKQTAPAFRFGQLVIWSHPCPFPASRQQPLDILRNFDSWIQEKKLALHEALICHEILGVFIVLIVLIILVYFLP